MASIAIDRTDGLSSATAIKGPVRVTTTANIALTGLQTIDGVSLAAGDRVLVKDQTTASENGIYVVDTGPWRRAKDFAGNRDVKKGTQILVTSGTLYASSGWYVSTADPIVIGTTSIQFTQNILLNAAQLTALEAAAGASADAASASATAAGNSAANAAASAAGVNLPSITVADAGKTLAVKSDGSGYETRVGETFVNGANHMVLDGTDRSAELQAVIDANKGATIVLPEDKVCLAAGIYLNGPSYNGTKLDFRGEFKLKPAPTLGSVNGFGQGWSGIEVRDCEVEINGRFDGNRAAQQDKEQTFVLAVSGAKLRSSDKLIFREIRGDGIYITQRDFNALSPDPEFDLNYVAGRNSADDGRNLISVISCAKGTMGQLVSRNVGGVVGGARMPGGLDFEPNYSGQSAKNVTIGSVDIEGAGSTNLQIFGGRFSDAAKTIPEPNASKANINIGTARVVNTIAPSVADEFTNVTQTNFSCCVIEGVIGVSIGFLDTEFTQAYGDALVVRNGASDITIKGRGKKVRQSLFGTGVGTSERGCKNLNIHFDEDDISRFGHALGVIEGGRISGRLTNPKSAYYSARYAVHTLPPSTGSLTNLELSHEIPGHANWTRSYRNSAGMTYTNTVINGAKLPDDGAWAAELNRIGDMPILRVNCPGVTDMAAMPAAGTWSIGQIVRNTNAVSLSQPEYWRRLTAGSANVAGTDWELIGRRQVFTLAFDPPSIAAGAVAGPQAITLTGASVGDLCQVSWSANPSGVDFNCEVSTVDTGQIYMHNRAAVTRDLASGTAKVVVTRA